MALNNLQGLIYYKAQPTNQISHSELKCFNNSLILYYNSFREGMESKIRIDTFAELRICLLHPLLRGKTPSTHSLKKLSWVGPYMPHLEKKISASAEEAHCFQSSNGKEMLCDTM